MKKQEDIIGKNLLADQEDDKEGQKNPDETQETKSLLIKMPEEVQPSGNPVRKISFPKVRLLRSKRTLGIIGGVIVLLMLFVVLPLVGVVRAVGELSESGRGLATAIPAQDINALKTNVNNIEDDLKDFDRSLTPLAWMRIIPWVGGYWQDAKNGAEGGIAATQASKVLIPAVEPFADLLGFGSGQPQAADGAKTAEERIDFIVEAIPAITPKLKEVGGDFIVARDKLTAINPNRYPEEIRGKPVRRMIRDLQGLITSVVTLVTDGKPLLESVPYLLGEDKERTYLVIFQNDKELRPTGGFMTAYSLVKVNDGEVKPVSSDDIYNLDSRYKARLQAPQPFLDHIKQPYSGSPLWRLRDMNWSPDFKDTMKLFAEEAQTAGVKGIDGIIAVDTNVLVSILQVTGPIGVPGYGNFSAENDKRCDCPQVIYELESYADVERPIVWDPNTGKIVYGGFVDNRKAILGPLVNSVLANALAQPKEKVPALATGILSNLQEKHVLFYVFDEKTQSALESFNIAGRIKDTDGDYLAIVDANLGGRKSNLYVTQEVEDEVKVEKDKTKHKLTITYKNPQRHDGWLNSVLPNSVRVYVPKDAKLMSSSGAGDIETSEEIGKTVFSGFFELRPEGVVKVVLEYEVLKGGNPYTFLIQQQPGKLPSRYTVTARGNTEEFELKSDQLLRFE